MRRLPFEPAPLGVDVATPVDVVEALVALAAADGRYVQPQADERALLRLSVLEIEGVMTISAQRHVAVDLPQRTPPPLTFSGEVVPAAGGARIVGSIVAPIPSALWVLPSLSFAIGLLGILNGNMIAAAAGLVLAAVTYGVFRLNQWDTLRDAPQLERALAEVARPAPGPAAVRRAEPPRDPHSGE